MDALEQLLGFFDAVSDDHRIGATHISLYMAFFTVWMRNGCNNPVTLGRAAVMRDAKISSRDTYSKCVQELHQYGYILYIPSFNACVPSMVNMVSLR
jgi:hypothetical protein